ncbi:YolA family protein [Bacillus sp. NP157]|nr:YolA family protein [Bacillus sp. NP157]
MGTTINATAAPSVSAYVYSVESEKVGREIVTGRQTTQRDHGGRWLYIKTDEIGMGNAPQARLLGSPLKEIATERLCNTGRGVGACKRGDTIVGYRRTWDASGREGGNFEFMIFPRGPGATVRVGFQVQ